MFNQNFTYTHHKYQAQEMQRQADRERQAREAQRDAESTRREARKNADT